MKTFKPTSNIRFANECASQMIELVNRLSRPRKLWERPVGTTDLLEAFRALAAARSTLFRDIERVYPELVGHSYDVSPIEIRCETLDEPPSVAALDPHADSTGTLSTREKGIAS